MKNLVNPISLSRCLSNKIIIRTNNNNNLNRYIWFLEDCFNYKHMLTSGYRVNVNENINEINGIYNSNLHAMILRYKTFLNDE